jgi:hypothetical protein
MRNRTLRGCLIALAIVLGSCPTSSKEVKRDPIEEPKNQSPTNNQAETDKPPIVIYVPPPEKTKQEIEQETKDRSDKADLDKKLVNLTGGLAYYTLGLFIATFALVITSAGLLYLGHKQSVDMKASIAVAKEAADAAMLQARAAIGVELPRLILTKLDFGDMGAAGLASRLQLPKIEITVTNYGRTPAFLLGQAGEIEICPVLPDKPVYPNAFDLPPETIVEYRQRYALRTVRPRNPTSPDDIQAIIDGRIRLWVYGYVWYRDFLGDRHMARFCKLFLPPSNIDGRYHFVDEYITPYTESF